MILVYDNLYREVCGSFDSLEAAKAFVAEFCEKHIDNEESDFSFFTKIEED